MDKDTLRQMHLDVQAVLAELKPHSTPARELIRWLRRTRNESPGDRLARRADFAATVYSRAENGLVALVTSGMDCDCVQYCYSYVVTAVPFAIRHEIDGKYNWADGPMHCHVCKPSERPEAFSRDLAMEAYENGHPHIVYAGA